MKSHKLSSGIEGLDYILNGGIPKDSTVLLEGSPGTGKTILGMQFLVEGARKYDEPGIYLTFEELPEQIYNEMLSFSWDVRSLEKENKLKVVTLSPEVLIDQMKKTNGLLDQLISELGCKRIVIDSINLIKLTENDLGKQRKILYTLRNILRKHQVTSLLIHEQTYVEDASSFVDFLVDGVIKLSLSHHMEIYRKRTLEVLKMRGTKILEGEHIYRISDNGIYLIPALSMIEDRVLTEQNYITTGLPRLDSVLSGGIPRGSAFVFDTNSKSNYKYIIASILSERLKKGEHLIIMLSSLNTISELEHLYQFFGVSFLDEVKKKKLYFIEHYDRPAPAGFEDAVIRIEDFNNTQYIEFLQERLGNRLDGTDEKWSIYYELNTVVSERGKDFILTHFANEVSRMRSVNITMFALCNFTEIGAETASFLERTCNGVVRTWVDGNYQYLQLKKSPQGNMSMPLLVENINTVPFLRLI